MGRLVGIVQGRADEEFAARTADYAWLIAALRHQAAAQATAPVATAAGR